MEVIIKPIISEKMTGQAEKFSRYGFFVNKKANKIEIKKAVEKMYSVTVETVNTSNNNGKLKTRHTKAGAVLGRINRGKKALVTLKKGETIDFYSNI